MQWVTIIALVSAEISNCVSINKAPEEWFFAHTSREKKTKIFWH